MSNNADRAQEYTERAIKFVGEKLLSIYCRSKMAVVSPKPGAPAPTPEQVEEIREQARAYNYYLNITGLDVDSRNVADFLTGLTGSVTPSTHAIEQMADAHGITNEQAADMIRARRLAMMADSQRRNLHKHASIVGWCADVDKFGVSESSDTRHMVDTMIEGALVEQYRQAGRYASLAGRYVVESYAKEFGVVLPKWADVLPRWTEQSSKELERVTRIQEAEADRRQQEEARISLDLAEQFGEF